MKIRLVAQEMTVRLETITKLNGFPYWIKKVPVPGFTIGLPERIAYDQTYGRGLDKITFPVLVVVGPVSSEQAARDLEAYMDGSGPRSFKQILNPPGWESCDDVCVTEAVPDTYMSGGVFLLGAEFTVDVHGQGETS